MNLQHQITTIGMVLALSVVASAAPVAPETCYQTSQAANGHTCGHGTNGPFANRVAQPYPPNGFPENVDPTHTLYTLLLSGESASNQWVVTYRPTVAGAYAFYMKFPGNETTDEEPYPLELQDGLGDPIPLRFEHGYVTCSQYLTWIKVYDLDAAQYRLVIGGEANQSVKVAIEHLNAFPGPVLFRDADGDGHGDPEAQNESWCGAATGYVFMEDADDCDDDDATTHPGVAETCNGVDDDCSGAVDDGAAVCDDGGSAETPNMDPPPDAGDAGNSSGGASFGDDGGLAGAPNMDPPPDAGTAGNSSGGVPPADVGDSQAPDGDATVPNGGASAPEEETPVDPNDSDASCSCSMVRTTPIGTGAVSFLLVASLALARRRRRNAR